MITEIKMKTKLNILVSALVVFALISSIYVPAQAAMVSTIDFEGLAEGAIVGTVTYGAGISGDPISGSVAVYGYNPFFPNANAAMIFDSACPGGCSGQDNDLYWPDLGKTLIVSEDMDSGDPDDSDSPLQYFTFDYANLGPGKVTVDSIVFGDVESVESGGTVKLYGNSILLATVVIPVTGDNVAATLTIGVAGVDFMRVDLNGSAAIDNIKISVDEPPPPGEEGCTPGYWKNHPKAWAATGYTTTMTVEDVFDVPDAFNLDSKTLLQALSFLGGPYKLGASRILLRAATAAVLNAAHPDVDYPLTDAEIISQVNTALSGTRAQMLALKTTLDMYNNLGCPIN
jgi:hypothetical protein